MGQLTVITGLKVKSDALEAVKPELLKLATKTRAEKGCLNFDLHQDNDNPAHFLIYGRWESRDYWKTHMNNQPLKNYMGSTKNTVEEFSLNEMTLIT